MRGGKVATVNLAPGPFGAGYQAFDNNGYPLNGGFLNTYLAGTSTPAATYTTSAGNIANSVNIQLDASGRPPAEIWLVAGNAYKFVLTDSLSNIIGTYDNLIGINDFLTQALSQWVDFGVPAFLSTTSFSVLGNQTSIFEPGRRVKTTNAGGTIYSTIESSVFSVVTTVTVINDSGVLDSGISDVAYSILTASDSAIPFLGFAPPGTLFDFAGTSAPVGWLTCDGSNVSRTTYALLFAAIGTTWGVGNGTTTFGIPNFQRRTSIGSGGSGTGTIGNVVGNTGGEETHALTSAENGAHAHSVTDPTHTHAVTQVINQQVPSGGQYAQAAGGTWVSDINTGAAATGISIQNSGSGTAHNTMQPSAVVLKIIKV